MINLFEKAIKKRELLNFSLGKDDYFIVDREYGEHSILSSWTYHILPVSLTKGVEYMKNKVIEMISEVISSDSLDKQQKAENILYHLHVYYYLGSQGKLTIESFEEINLKIEKCFSDYLTIISDHQKIESFKRAIDLIKSRGGLSTPNAV